MEYCGKALTEDLNCGDEPELLCDSCIRKGHGSMLKDMIRLKEASRSFVVGEIESRDLWRLVHSISMEHSHGYHLEDFKDEKI